MKVPKSVAVLSHGATGIRNVAGRGLACQCVRGVARKEVGNGRVKGKDINPCTLPIPEGTYNIIYFHLSPSVDLKEAMSMSLPLAPRGAVFIRVSPTNIVNSFKLIEAWGLEYRTGMAVILPDEDSNPWVRGMHDLVFVCIRRGKSFVPCKVGRKAVIFSSVLDTRSPITTEVTVTDMIMSKIRNHYPGCRFLKAELIPREAEREA